jgi:thymidine kinase
MFSKKTDELITILKRKKRGLNTRLREGLISKKEARETVLAFKPLIDNRYGNNSLGSHTGSKFRGRAIDHEHPELILNYVTSNTKMVAVDEVQFFPKTILDVFQELNNRNIKVYTAGLDLNFRGESFGIMGDILTRADKVTKLTAVCTKCGSDNATRTQRMIVELDENKKEISRRPANYDEETVVIGDDKPAAKTGTTEIYEARCKKCHEVPGKPLSGIIFQSK